MHYAERGDGPTALALHAATSEGAEMGWLAHAMQRQGFNVVAPDQRGHGQTANPASDIHLPRLVDDILEFLYLLGRTPVHGVGYSLGGAVLLYAALRRPEFFRSLALLGTSYRTPWEERLRKVLGPHDQRPPEQQMVFDPVTGASVGWTEPVEAFGRIAMPTLILCADRDEFNDVEDSLALYRAMPNAELLVVPHCDHLGLVRHPMVFQAVSDFYARVPR
jgi:pimeloyl-ACP methyl ester carboxylesterase